MNNLFLIRTVERNLRELEDANFMVLVLDQLENTRHPLNFFTIAAVALYNDVISHLCKVYEINGGGKSFWYIEKKLTKDIHSIADNHSISINDLKDISYRLKNIRNKTHFHIGTQVPNNPKLVWEEFKIKKYEARNLIESGRTILIKVYESMSEEEYPNSDYDGLDVKDIIESYMKIHSDSGIIVT